MRLTILGMGAMGSRMADRLEAAGHQVTRWNRTGAAHSPREAVRDAEFVIAMVRDDDASRSIWLGADGALAGLSPDAIAIESSTLSADWVRALGDAMAQAGRAFLDAPVLGSRPQAEAGQLIHLVGGDAGVLERVRPLLAVLGGVQLHAGPMGAGAALKLVANALFGIQVAAVAELIARMPALGLASEDAIALLGQTPVMSPAASGAAALMLQDRHGPMFPVDLVVKDFGYAIGTSANDLPVTQAARQAFGRASASGLGGKHLTAVFSLYRRG